VIQLRQLNMTREPYQTSRYKQENSVTLTGEHFSPPGHKNLMLALDGITAAQENALSAPERCITNFRAITVAVRIASAMDGMHDACAPACFRHTAL
jgi:hypothetical protein